MQLPFFHAPLLGEVEAPALWVPISQVPTQDLCPSLHPSIPWSLGRCCGASRLICGSAWPGFGGCFLHHCFLHSSAFSPLLLFCYFPSWLFLCFKNHFVISWLLFNLADGHIPLYHGKFGQISPQTVLHIPGTQVVSVGRLCEHSGDRSPVCLHCLT